MSTTLTSPGEPPAGDADAERNAGPPAGHAPRRGHLDGLRVVAVYLVVAFHAGTGRLSGGFIGVDVFFVLSGYLVTQVLLRDVAGSGGIRFGRFYSRRVRRLLPASLVVLVISALVYAALATPAQVSEATSAFQTALLYISNWYFIDQSTGYFATDAAQSPVLQFWSLAVEEQFYLLWPLLLGGLLWATRGLGRHRWNALRLAVLLGGIASAAWALWLRADQPDRAYFGTDTRAYQLLAGALIALTPGLVRRAAHRPRITRAVAALALAGVVGLGTNLIAGGPIVRGVAATAATALLIVALDAEVAGATKRLLSLTPITYLGRISYGTYLWHWPALIVLTELIEISAIARFAIVALLATALAALSNELVEIPLRRAGILDRYRWPVVGVGLALSIVVALVVVPRTAAQPETATAAAEASTERFTPVPDDLDQGAIYFEKFGETVKCTEQPAEDCTVVRGDGSHILLMGDSNAQMWIPAFTAMAEQQGLTLSLAVTAGCPWQREFFRLSDEIRAECRRTKDDAYDRLIPSLDPELIVVVNAQELREPLPAATFVDAGYNSTLRDTTRRSAEELVAGGRQLLIIEPAPTPRDDFNPLQCLGGASVVEECRFVTPTEPTWLEVDERKIAEGSDQIVSADLDRLICPFLPICDPMSGATPVFWNKNHITARFSRSLDELLAAFLVGQGIISPAPSR